MDLKLDIEIIDGYVEVGTEDSCITDAWKRIKAALAEPAPAGCYACLGTLGHNMLELGRTSCHICGRALSAAQPVAPVAGECIRGGRECMWLADQQTRSSPAGDYPCQGCNMDRYESKPAAEKEG